MRSAFFPLIISVALLGGDISAAAAQAPEASVRTGSSAPASPVDAPPKTIKQALDKSAWDPEQRGPLIVIAPDEFVAKPQWLARYEEMMKRGGSEKGIQPPYPIPASNGQYRVPEIAEFYGRRLVRLKGITVLAPETMIVLNDNPGKPDIYAGMQQMQKIQMFQATLTEAQWNALGSKQGLGYENLQQEQRDLFLACLPDPFIVMRGVAMEGGGTRFGGDAGSSEPTRLTGDSRRSIRLRMSRTVNMSLYAKNGSQASAMVGGRRTGEEVLRLSYSNRNDREQKPFGQTLRSDIPIVLKPQQINFDAASLNPQVSLAGVVTPGDLVARIRIATKQEIYIDPRLAKQKMWLKTGPETMVRAGELLRALCWSVAGAVRYLPEAKAFILTDNIVGWGTRVARIQAWNEMAEGMRQLQMQKYAEAIRKQKPMQFLTFDEKDPMAVKPNVLSEIETKLTEARGRYEGISVPLTSLSTEQQQFAADSANQHNRRFTSSNYTPTEWDQPVTTDRVRLTMNVRLFYTVSGVGDVEDETNSWGLMDPLLPTPTMASVDPSASPAGKKDKDKALLPETRVGGILQVAPKDENQAIEAVRIARERGFNQVWLVLPTPKFSDGVDAQALPNYDAAAQKGKAFLTAAINEAKANVKQPIIVSAVTSVLTAMPISDRNGANSASFRNLDHNLLGETASQSTYRQAALIGNMGPEGNVFSRFIQSHAREWLLPDSPLLDVHLKRYLSDLAGVPGLSGMALTDVVASGYEPKATGEDVYYMGAGMGTTPLGYVSAYRADFLKSGGYDPIDIAPRAYVNGVDLNHPFLGSATPTYTNEGKPVSDERTTAGAQWSKVRFQHAEGLLSGIYDALSKSQKLLLKSDIVPPLSSGGTAASSPKQNTSDGKFALYVTPFSSGNQNYVLWDRPDLLSTSQMAQGEGIDYRDRSYKSSRAASSRCLLTCTYLDPMLFAPLDSAQKPITQEVRAKQFADRLNQMLTYNKGNWDGYIIDLTDTDVSEIRPLLSVIRFAAPMPRPGNAAIR